MNIPTCLSTQSWWIRPWWCKIKFSFWFQIQYFFPPYLSCKSYYFQVLRGWPSSCGSGGIHYLRHRPSQVFCGHLPVLQATFGLRASWQWHGRWGQNSASEDRSLDLTISALHSFTLSSVLEWVAGLENTWFLKVTYLFGCAGSLLLCRDFLWLQWVGATLVVVRRLLIVAASCCRARELWHTGLVAPSHVGSSWTRDQTHVLCTGRQILNHWTTGEVPGKYFRLAVSKL